MLFKYISPEGLISLQTKRLKTTPPNQFNDPFEFIPKITGVATVDETKAYLAIDSVLEEHYDNLVREDGLNMTLEEFKADIRQRIDDYCTSIVFTSGKKDMQWKFAREIVDDVSKSVGVVCLSRTPTNILMWSHYADSHEGLVLGLNEDDNFFQDALLFCDVKYATRRPVFDQSWLDGSRELIDLADHLIKTKFTDWSYEQEVRATFNLSDCEEISVHGGQIYVKEFSPTLIQEVITGCRCSEETAAKLSSLLEQECYSHVRVLRADLDPDDYRMVISEL